MALTCPDTWDAMVVDIVVLPVPEGPVSSVFSRDVVLIAVIASRSRSGSSNSSSLVGSYAVVNGAYMVSNSAFVALDPLPTNTL